MGFGLGAFVVSTNEIVVNCASVVVGRVVVVNGFRVVESVTFLREIVVRRFTAIVVLATGFLVVFTTVVAFFDGLTVVPGRLVGRVLNDPKVDGTGVLLGTGFLVTTVVLVGFTFWTVIEALD